MISYMYISKKLISAVTKIIIIHMCNNITITVYARLTYQSQIKNEYYMVLFRIWYACMKNKRGINIATHADIKE